jgi:hypothetical protein
MLGTSCMIQSTVNITWIPPVYLCFIHSINKEYPTSYPSLSGLNHIWLFLVPVIHKSMRIMTTLEASHLFILRWKSGHPFVYVICFKIITIYLELNNSEVSLEIDIFSVIVWEKHEVYFDLSIVHIACISVEWELEKSFAAATLITGLQIHT